MAEILVTDWSQYPTLLNAQYSRIVEQEYASMTDIRPEIYDMIRTDRYEDHITSLGELGVWGEFNFQLEYDQQYEQFQTMYRTREYATATAVTRRMVRDDLMGVIDGKRFRPMVLAGIKTLQYHATLPFEFLDTLDTHYYVYNEGVPLASTAHRTRTPGVSTAEGFDNIILGPWSEVTFRAALIQGRKIRSDRGDRMNLSYDKVYAPVDLVPSVNEVLRTPWGLNTPFRNENQESSERSGVMRVVGLEYWTATDRVVLVNSPLEKVHMKWVTSEDPDFGRITEFDTFQIKARAYMRHGYARTDWRQYMIIMPE